jgi:hypothetical protein
VRKASTRYCTGSLARLPESENNDGQGAAGAAAADAGFVTILSGPEENVALANGFPDKRSSYIGTAFRDKSLWRAGRDRPSKV